MRLILLTIFLTGCATPSLDHTGGLTHAISGPFHVLLGPPNRVDEACRGVRTEGDRRIRGCYLRAGDTYWMWIAEDQDRADTIAHEWRHSIEGDFH